MKVRAAIFAFGGVIGAGIAVVVLLSTVTVNRIKVGGPVYDQIVQGKDLVADILPPPLYIVEAYLEATLAANQSKPVDESVSQLKKLHGEFQDRQTFWLGSNLRADIKSKLTQDSHRHATAFWDIVNSELLSALAAGDQPRARTAYARLSNVYAAHRSVVDELVALAEAMNKEIEAGAAHEEKLAALLLAAIVAALFAVVAAGVIAINKGVITPLTRLTGVMSALSSGKVDTEIEAVKRKDEIGEMARAVQVFKDNAIELEQAKVAAAEQETLSEVQRARNEAARVETARQVDMVLVSLGRGLDHLAQGDLTHHLTQDFAAEYNAIKDDFNTAIKQLQNTVRRIAESSSEIANAAREISTSTTDLSQRTEEQAASLEQTSASMEEIAVTIKKNAENAQQASGLARSAREVADRSGTIVESAVSAMSRIEESSRNISDIISVIDEIARQTNLLALNAAVEAARAGEAGRGFAVVASEVRTLAQRSSQAAKDITDLIVRSSNNVQNGVELVNRAGASLSEIAQSIVGVTNIVADIANASAEQSVGIDQINRALVQMDEATQQNSALVEQNAATARKLEEQSAAMDQMLRAFQLKADRDARAAALRSVPDKERRRRA